MRSFFDAPVRGHVECIERSEGLGQVVALGDEAGHARAECRVSTEAPDG